MGVGRIQGLGGHRRAFPQRVVRVGGASWVSPTPVFRLLFASGTSPGGVVLVFFFLRCTAVYFYHS